MGTAGLGELFEHSLPIFIGGFNPEGLGKAEGLNGGASDVVLVGDDGVAGSVCGGSSILSTTLHLIALKTSINWIFSKSHLITTFYS